MSARYNNNIIAFLTAVLRFKSSILISRLPGDGRELNRAARAGSCVPYAAAGERAVRAPAQPHNEGRRTVARSGASRPVAAETCRASRLVAWRRSPPSRPPPRQPLAPRLATPRCARSRARPAPRRTPTAGAERTPSRGAAGVARHPATPAAGTRNTPTPRAARPRRRPAACAPAATSRRSGRWAARTRTSWPSAQEKSRRSRRQSRSLRVCPCRGSTSGRAAAAR